MDRSNLTTAVAPPSREALDQLIALIKKLNEDVRFAPAEGGSEMDEVSHSRYGRFFRDHGADLVSLLAVPPPRNGWQPIDTAPKHQEVLLWWPYWSKRAGVGYWKHDRWIAEHALSDHTTAFNSYPGPTHWMSLPDPPGAVLAVPPPQEAPYQQAIHEDLESRVPGVPSDPSLGSTAEQSKAVVTDAKRTER